ncbi:MAG: hypothetical protein U1E81_09725 [Xanthobacteraceae bacterium]
MAADIGIGGVGLGSRCDGAHEPGTVSRRSDCLPSANQRPASQRPILQPPRMSRESGDIVISLMPTMQVRGQFALYAFRRAAVSNQLSVSRSAISSTFQQT